MLLLSGCVPEPIQPEVGTFPTNNPVVTVLRGGTGMDVLIRVEIITVGGKKFAVASYEHNIAICEVTTHNVGY